MTPQTIIDVLDKHARRINMENGQVKWAGKREWFAQFNTDNEPLWVAWNQSPGVWLERTTKFAKPYDLPRSLQAVP